MPKRTMASPWHNRHKRDKVILKPIRNPNILAIAAGVAGAALGVTLNKSLRDLDYFGLYHDSGGEFGSGGFWLFMIVMVAGGAYTGYHVVKGLTDGS